MSIKTVKNEFSDAIVRIVARRRITSRSNWPYLMSNEINDTYLRQLNEKEREKLLKATITNGNATHDGTVFRKGSGIGWNNGYIEGLLYGKKMLDEENYTKAEMIRLIKLIPNSVASCVLGETFGLGFIEGLFGGDGKSSLIINYSEKNYFIKKWKSAITHELYEQLCAAS